MVKNVEEEFKQFEPEQAFEDDLFRRQPCPEIEDAASGCRFGKGQSQAQTRRSVIRMGSPLISCLRLRHPFFGGFVRINVGCHAFQKLPRFLFDQ